MAYTGYNNDYTNAVKAVRDAATAEFNEVLIQTKTTDDTRQQNTRRREYVSKAEETWFRSQPEGCSITVQHGDNRDEISDQYFSGSITVYGPARDIDWEASRNTGKNIFKITPGHINSSTWSVGGQGCDAWMTARELNHRLRMMAIAVELLNKRNQLCLDWENFESPFQLAEEALRHRENVQAERAKEQEKLAKKAGKK